MWENIWNYFLDIYRETFENYGDYINLYKNKNWVRAEK